MPQELMTDNSFLIADDSSNEAIMAISKELLTELKDIDVAMSAAGETMHEEWGFDLNDINIGEMFSLAEVEHIENCLGVRATAYRYRKVVNLLHPCEKLGKLSLLLNCYPLWGTDEVEVYLESDDESVVNINITEATGLHIGDNYEVLQAEFVD